MVGLVSLILGGLGVVLPVLPTTPFIILAAFAFGKSFPSWRNWLLNSKTFGPMIEDWEATGAIAPRYKYIAYSMMAAALLLSIYLQLGVLILVIQSVCMLGAFLFIYTRPDGTA